MNYLTFLKKLLIFFLRLFLRRRPSISILIPFSSGDEERKKTFEWLLKYWKCELPKAEIIIGSSDSEVFCKGQALNRAIKQSTGRVIVIMDADAYISGDIIRYCARNILRHLDNHLWYVPYRHLYRLTKEATQLVLDSDPCSPVTFSSPPPLSLIEDDGKKAHYGHRYGAMCMMFPREAYDTLGCFDERFKGWGGEDVALLRALDTLYGKHKTTNNDILHLYHPYIGESYKTRKWAGQTQSNPNSSLASSYHVATRHPSKMRALVDKGCECLK